jgi:hypothetical protein
VHWEDFDDDDDDEQGRLQQESIVKRTVEFIVENRGEVKVLLLEILKDRTNASNYGLELNGGQSRGMKSIVIIHIGAFHLLDSRDPYIQGCISSVERKRKNCKVSGTASITESEIIDRPYEVPPTIRGASFSTAVKNTLVDCKREMEWRDRTIAEQEEHIITLELISHSSYCHLSHSLYILLQQEIIVDSVE